MPNSVFHIDTEQLRKNIRAHMGITKANILLVVKANAYGHGIVKISKIATEEGVRVLGVVNTEELQTIRDGGVKTDVFLLGAVDFCDFETAITLNAHIPVWRFDQLEELDMVAKKLGTTAKYQIPVDTGMGRLGMLPKELDTFFPHIKNFKNIKCCGIYSHFFGSDLEDLSGAFEQLRLFKDAVSKAQSYGIAPEFIHIANSPATLRLPETHFNLVRVGISAYGMPPDTGVPVPPGVAPIGSWRSKLLNIKMLPAGHGISYGSEYRTTQEQKIGVVPVGYADGFRRKPPRVNTVLIRGIEVSVLGRVCMDHVMIDLSNVPDATLGDKITLIGKDNDKFITAEMVADRWGTNNYDVIANIGSRVRREYSDENESTI